MGSERGLGVQRKSMKRRKSKGFVRALVAYLVSDTYMYAPLIDSPPSTPPESPETPTGSTDLQRASPSSLVRSPAKIGKRAVVHVLYVGRLVGDYAIIGQQEREDGLFPHVLSEFLDGMHVDKLPKDKIRLLP